MTTAPTPSTSSPPAAVPIGFDPKYLRKFQDKLFIEGPATRRRLLNFFVLLILATIIATYGLISDSPATVIGAMIVAPLMQPIIATTAAVVMGSLRRTLLALTLVLGGMLLVVLLAALLTRMLPDILISFETNNEIVSRISPGLIALLTALASGTAGAFIATREEIADSLAGVAIAISLVPPLCVVGIAAAHLHWGAAFGALLLFMTNFLAILLAGGVVFLLLGLGRLANSERDRTTRRNGMILIAAATLLVAVPLTITTTQAVRGALENRIALDVVVVWLEGSTSELEKVAVVEDEVDVYVMGTPGPRQVQTLADNLAEALGRPLVVSLRQIPSDVVRTASSRAPEDGHG